MCGDSAFPKHSTEELLAAPHRPHFLAHHINKRIADARGIPEFARQTLPLDLIPEQARGACCGSVFFVEILCVVFCCVLLKCCKGGLWP